MSAVMVEWRGSKRIRSARAPAAFIDPALPVKADRPPSGANWIHEIKHDGYRLQIHKHGKTVRLFTMTGVDWTARYPWIVEGAAALNADAAVIDAECCVAGHDGVTRFDALHDADRGRLGLCVCVRPDDGRRRGRAGAAD